MTSPQHVNIVLAEGVSPKEQAALVVIMEEASELAQAAGKILRFGYTATDQKPGSKTFGNTYDNVSAFNQEVKDLRGAIERFTALAAI